MGGTAKMNAMRSGLVVVGALAFGYLTLQLGFKPFLERAQLEQQRQEEVLAQARTEDSFVDSFHTDTIYLILIYLTMLILFEVFFSSD
ncbi:hypothetical protein ACJIZ3_017624 [Penstemon smallii]|uniref:Uncharacterized protein n=1 Tax=Penstemon smallii TaxID=265156 RepID=A0ABD3SW50_9LAMI